MHECDLFFISSHLKKKKTRTTKRIRADERATSFDQFARGAFFIHTFGEWGTNTPSLTGGDTTIPNPIFHSSIDPWKSRLQP